MAGAPFSQVCNSLTAADITQLEEQLQEDDKDGQWWMAGQVATANVVCGPTASFCEAVSVLFKTATLLNVL